MFPRFIRAALAACLLFAAHGAVAQVVLNPSTTLACPDAAPGTEVKCGTYTVINHYSNSKKILSYGSTPPPAGFRIDEETCTINKLLSEDKSCTFSIYFTGQPTPGPVNFSSCLKYETSGTCKNYGARANTILSYAWVTGEWSPQGSCSSSVAQTRPVICRSSAGEDMDDSFCTESKPNETRSVADFSGCTYSWQTSAWSACHGGTGSFDVTPWTPSVGCGPTQQNRTATCIVTTGSGTHDRDVTCLRSNGQTVSDSYCEDAPRPLEEGSCNPEPTVCGQPPETSRTQTLSNGCTGDEGDEGTETTPPPSTTPASTKKELCVPDAANNKYCIYLPMHQ